MRCMHACIHVYCSPCLCEHDVQDMHSTGVYVQFECIIGVDMFV